MWRSKNDHKKKNLTQLNLSNGKMENEYPPIIQVIQILGFNMFNNRSAELI